MISNPLQEDLGLIEIHKVCIEMQAIWRPTPCHDLGVDGQIEFLEQTDNVISTGKIVAVQVKSGPSYFKTKTETHVKYYPSEKHRRYWQSLNLPIIIVLHCPNTGQTIYANLKSQLDFKSPILVPLDQCIHKSVRADLLTLCDYIDDPAEVLFKLKNVTYMSGWGKTVSGIEFLLSCLNLRHEYFELRMVRILEMLELSLDGDGGLCTGSLTYDFIHRCSSICMSAKISESFSEIYDYYWYELEQVPEFTVLLTPFGSKVADYLIEHANQLVRYETFSQYGFDNAREIAIWLEKSCQRASEQMDAWNDGVRIFESPDVDSR
jgi:hypothetical protein